MRIAVLEQQLLITRQRAFCGRSGPVHHSVLQDPPNRPNAVSTTIIIIFLLSTTTANNNRDNATCHNIIFLKTTITTVKQRHGRNEPGGFLDRIIRIRCVCACATFTIHDICLAVVQSYSRRVRATA